MLQHVYASKAVNYINDILMKWNIRNYDLHFGDCYCKCNHFIKSYYDSIHILTFVC